MYWNVSLLHVFYPHVALITSEQGWTQVWRPAVVHWKKRKRTITYVIWFGCFFLKSTTRRRRCHGCRHVPHVRHVARYIVCCCWLEHTDDRHANVDTQWIDNAETQETNVSQNPSLRTADWHMVSWEEWNKY
mgnify:CR=1 FL=1